MAIQNRSKSFVQIFMFAGRWMKIFQSNKPSFEISEIRDGWMKVDIVSSIKDMNLHIRCVWVFLIHYV